MKLITRILENLPGLMVIALLVIVFGSGLCNELKSQTPGFSPCGINYSDGTWGTTAGMGYFHGYEIARPYDIAWGNPQHGQVSFKYTARDDWNIMLELDLQISPTSVLIVVLNDNCDTVQTVTSLLQLYLLDKKLKHDEDYYVHVDVYHQTPFQFGHVAFIRIIPPKIIFQQTTPYMVQQFWNNQGMYQLRIIKPALMLGKPATVIRMR